MHVVLVTGLIAIGGSLYLFRQRSKMVYGLSEVLVGILANLTLISHIDFRKPLVASLRQNSVPIGAFTYLLSRGISNAVDGYAQKKASDRGSGRVDQPT